LSGECAQKELLQNKKQVHQGIAARNPLKKGGKKVKKKKEKRETSFLILGGFGRRTRGEKGDVAELGLPHTEKLRKPKTCRSTERLRKKKK